YRFLFLAGIFLFWFAQTFLLFVEFFFFDEFKSRYNTVAVDYLWEPREVVDNIWQSYHVGIIVAICLVTATGWLLMAHWWFADMWRRGFTFRARLAHLLLALLIAFGLARTMPLKGASPTSDRTLNEIANNGLLSLAAAAWTRNLDYTAFYKTL